MTERTTEAARNQGATKGESAAAAAGLTPKRAPERERAADDLPLEEGAVRNGGAYMGGDRPADADREDADDEPRRPLDSRETFGGDGARYVDPALGSADTGSDEQNARRNATAAGEDGFEPTAEPGIDQDQG